MKHTGWEILFQDNNFEFYDFNGLALEQLIACENPETQEIVMVYIKVQGKDWHQFFLETGYGFWATHKDIHPTHTNYQDDSYNYIDKGAEYGISEEIVSRIWCEPDKNNCKITIELENRKRIILRTIDPALFETLSELVLIGP